MDIMTGSLAEYNPLGQFPAQQHTEQAIHNASAAAFVYQHQRIPRYKTQPLSLSCPRPLYTQMPYLNGASYASEFLQNQSVSGAPHGATAISWQGLATSMPFPVSFSQHLQQHVCSPWSYGMQPQFYNPPFLQSAQKIGHHVWRPRDIFIQNTLPSSDHGAVISSGDCLVAGLYNSMAIQSNAQLHLSTQGT